MAEQYCLKWNNHQSTLLVQFETLLESDTLTDCTLSADGKYLNVHKVLLSACSPYFSKLLGEHKDKHPIFFMKDVAYDELKGIVEYMYKGEVNVTQERLDSFLKTASSLQIKGLADSDGKGSDDGSDTGGGGNRSKRKTAPDLRGGGSGYDSAPAPEEQSPRSPKRRRRPRPVSQEDSPLPPLPSADHNHCDTSSNFATQPPPADIIMPTPMLPVRKTEPLDNSTVHLKTELPDDAPQVDVQDLTLDDDEEFNEDVTQPGTSFSESSQDFKWFQQQMANQPGGTMDDQFLSSTPAQQNMNQSPGTQGDKQSEKPGYRCKCGKLFINVDHFRYHVLKHCGARSTPPSKQLLQGEKRGHPEGGGDRWTESDEQGHPDHSTPTSENTKKPSREERAQESSKRISLVNISRLSTQSDCPKQNDTGLGTAELDSTCRRSIVEFSLSTVETLQKSSQIPSTNLDASNLFMNIDDSHVVIKRENLSNDENCTNDVANINIPLQVNEVTITPVGSDKSIPEFGKDVTLKNTCVQKKCINIVQMTKLTNIKEDGNKIRDRECITNNMNSVCNQSKSSGNEKFNIRSEEVPVKEERSMIDMVDISKMLDSSSHSPKVTKENKLGDIKSTTKCEIKKSFINVVDLSKISLSSSVVSYPERSKIDTLISLNTKEIDNLVVPNEKSNGTGISIVSVKSLSEKDFSNIEMSESSNINQDKSVETTSIPEKKSRNKSDRKSDIEIVSLLDEDSKHASSASSSRDNKFYKRKAQYYKDKCPPWVKKKKKGRYSDEPSRERGHWKKNSRGRNEWSRSYSRSNDRYHYYDPNASTSSSSQPGHYHDSRGGDSQYPTDSGTRSASESGTANRGVKESYHRKERFILPRETEEPRTKKTDNEASTLKQRKNAPKQKHKTTEVQQNLVVSELPSLLLVPQNQVILQQHTPLAVIQHETTSQTHLQPVTQSGVSLMLPQSDQRSAQAVDVCDLTQTSNELIKDQTTKRHSWHIPTTNY